MAEKVYIERDELESRIKKYVKCRDADRETLEWAKDECIRQAHCMPAADVVEVRHGFWIEKRNDVIGRYFTCSICGKDENHHTAIRGKYCWYCGAKMDGATDNNVGDKGGAEQ